PVRGGTPRRDDQQVGAQGVDLVADLGLGPLTETDGEDDGGDADEDPEHRQAGAQPVRPNGVEPGLGGVEPVHRRVDMANASLSSATRPSSMCTMPPGAAAMSAPR